MVMTTHGTGSFQVTSGEEDRYNGTEGGRGLAQADVTQDFTGEIEGTGSVRWLMCYRPNATADWLGLQRIVGRVGGRSGSFVLETRGTFDGSKAAGDWSVVPGSGTGDLEGLSGRGRIEAPMGAQATYTLDYDV
jgi:hypothetical protein